MRSKKYIKYHCIMNQNIRANIPKYSRRFPQVKGLRVMVSSRPDKRLVASFVLNGEHRLVHFGYRGPDGRPAITYSDSAGINSTLAPVSKRNSYRKRASKIKDSRGRYTYLLPGTANSLAYHLLW